jgi:hypothetical protein
LFDNADIRVNIAQTQGDADQLGGVIFWALDLSNYYAAFIQPDGNFTVVRFVQGKVLVPVSERVRDEVKKGAGQVNALRVVTSGNVATIYINDKQLTSFKGFPPDGGSRIGVHGESGANPSTWTFSDFSVRKGPEPPDQPTNVDDAPLLADNFSTLDPAWGDANDSQSVSDNRLILKLQPERIRRVLYNGALFGDVDIRLKVSAIKGDADEPAGVAFWGVDTANYYAALVQPDGKFCVARFVDGVELVPIPLQKKDEVPKDVGQVNALRVITSGNQVTVYINDTQVTSFKGYPPDGGSKIGVHAESGAAPSDWAFSELSVRQGPKPSADQAPQNNTFLLADDFSTLDPAWGLADDTQRIENNKLIFNVKPNTNYRDLYQARLFGDADIRVKVSELKGVKKTTTGVIFWGSNYSNHNLFAIRADGTLFIGQIIKGKWTINDLDPPDGAANIGAGQVNELRVVMKGKSAVLYVNDNQLATYTHGPATVGGMIGLYGEAGDDPCTCAFSNLTVRKAQ